MLAQACGGDAAPTPIPTSTSVLTVQDVLAKAVTAWGSVTSLHFVLEHERGGTPIVGGLELTRAEGDLVRPEKLKADLKATVLGIFLGRKVVIIGERAYLTNPITGQWESLQSIVSPVGFFDLYEGVSSILAGVRNATPVGQVRQAGTLAYHLRGTVDAKELRAMAGMWWRASRWPWRPG